MPKRDTIGVFNPDHPDPGDRRFLSEGKDLIFTEVLSFVERLHEFFTGSSEDAGAMITSYFHTLLQGSALNCSYDGTASPATSQLVLTWNETVTLSGTRAVFFADQPAGSTIGVPPPASWSLEYLDSSGDWTAVSPTTAYFTDVTDDPSEVGLEQVDTTALRATLIASGSGTQYGGVGVKEWEALAPTSQ